ncbi:MAG: methyltransferase domain-containing protein [Parachlamydiales bacterium]|nr:methyltransferase domain-containing protein [Parachlamydiales bacterium]
MKFILSIALYISLNAQSEAEKLFTSIYEKWPWYEEGFSISGSQIEITQEYVDFLQQFLKENQIRTVVDIGCGDWSFSRYIDWSGVEYLGIDIVKMVIDRNEKLFANDSIQFIYGDAKEIDLPEADLMVCKDVFQHLSNEDILALLKQTHKFKHCLVTNFVDPNTLSSSNPNISTGQFHYVDLSTVPFNIKGEKVLNFIAIYPKQTFHFRGRD